MAKKYASSLVRLCLFKGMASDAEWDIECPRDNLGKRVMKDEEVEGPADIAVSLTIFHRKCRVYQGG